MFQQAIYRNARIDVDDVPTATHWPSLDPVAAASEWRSLRDWVEQLVERFDFIDHHIIPACWYRHNGHVEALSALRDHEKVSYGPLAPATGPAEWIRALRDTASTLRSWTADLTCGSRHQEPFRRPVPSDIKDWSEHLEADAARRRGGAGVESSPA